MFIKTIHHFTINNGPTLQCNHFQSHTVAVKCRQNKQNRKHNDRSLPSPFSISASICLFIFLSLSLATQPHFFFLLQANTSIAKNSSVGLHKICIFKTRASVASSSAIKQTAEAYKQCWSLLLYR